MRIKDDVLQLARVPPFDERTERIYTLSQRHIVSRLPVERLAIELPLERLHRQMRGAQRDRHA